MDKIIMCYYLLLILFGIVFIIMLKVMKNNSVLKKKLLVVENDFNILQNRFIMQDDITKKINNISYSNIKSLEKIVNQTNINIDDKVATVNYIKQLIEGCNDIDVLTNDKYYTKKVKCDVVKEIENIFDEINIKGKFDLIVEKSLKSNIKIDIIKLISAIKRIIMLSLTNDKNRKINIFITEDNSNMKIKLENVKLINNQNENKIHDFFRYDYIEPYIGLNLDSSLLIIRKNLLCISNKVYFDEFNNLIIDIKK